jgi:hypothetical protein
MGKYISRVPENVKGYVVLSNIALHMWHATRNPHNKYKKSKTKRCVETLIKSCLLGPFLLYFWSLAFFKNLLLFPLLNSHI